MKAPISIPWFNDRSNLSLLKFFKSSLHFSWLSFKQMQYPVQFVYEMGDGGGEGGVYPRNN